MEHRAFSDFACVAAAWQTHHAELLGFLTHRLADVDSANDVLHDVFMKAMRQGHGFCDLDNPRAWLFQVARNSLVDRSRAARPADPMPSGIDELPAPESPVLAPIDDLANCVTRCMDELGADDAAIVRACDLEGRTVRSFAEDLGMSLPAAKSRLLRARQRLRARLIMACQIRFADDGTVDGHVPRE